MKFGRLESSPTKLLEFPEAREGGKPAVPAAGFKSGVRQALAAPPPGETRFPSLCSPRTERRARTQVTKIKQGHILWALTRAPRTR